MSTRDQKIKDIYGEPGDEKNLVSMVVPYPMKLSWYIKTIVTKIRCHKKIAEPLKKVFDEILTHYGLEKIKELKLDIFGGCYNFRPVRGGTNLSKHSWGIAIDLDPENNQLKWGKDKASFAKPEYKFMIDTFYKHGFESLGVEKNMDYMHFQIKI
jgi:hypothetical protein